MQDVLVSAALNLDSFDHLDRMKTCPELRHLQLQRWLFLPHALVEARMVATAYYTI